MTGKLSDKVTAVGNHFTQGCDQIIDASERASRNAAKKLIGETATNVFKGFKKVCS